MLNYMMSFENNQISRALKYFNMLRLKNVDYEIYTDAYKAARVLKGDLRPVFNPVPKVITTMTALTLQNGIEAISDGGADAEVEYINTLFSTNKFIELTQVLLYWLLMSRRAVLEVFSKDGEFSFLWHDVRQVTIERDVTKKIIYAKIVGTQQTWNPVEKALAEVTVTKEYINVPGLAIIRTVTDDNDETAVEVPLGYPEIPIVEFGVNYDIQHLLDITDEHNQVRFWLKKVFSIHGNTPMAGLGVKGEIKKAKNTEKVDDYEGVNIFQLGEGDLKYIEMNGNVAKLMMTELEALTGQVKIDYPEYGLADLVNGSAIAEETSKIQLIEVVARIKTIRTDFSEGLQDVLNIVYMYLGKAVPNVKFNFGSILPTGVNELLLVIKQLRTYGLISKKSALEKLVPTGYINNAADETKNLKDENTWDLLHLEKIAIGGVDAMGEKPEQTSWSGVMGNNDPETTLTNKGVGNVTGDTTGKRTSRAGL